MSALRSRNAAFAAYGVLLVLPTLVFGWLYWEQIVRDYELELQSAPDKALETAGRIADRLRERLSLLIEQEDRRHFSYYSQVFSPADALGDDLAVQPSPLTKEALPEGVLGWFSYDRLRWPVGDVSVFVGDGLPTTEAAARSWDIHGAALTFRELKEAEGAADRVVQMGNPRTQRVASRIVAVLISGHENLSCLTEHRDLMTDWSLEIDTSNFFLQFYRETSGVPRAVATRRVIMPPEYHPDHLPDHPVDAPCLAPLNSGLSLAQGFFIDLDWLLGDLLQEVGDLTLRESERLIRSGIDPDFDASCEVCTDIFPIEELGFVTSDPQDSRVGAIQVAIDTVMMQDRFRRQRNNFGGMAAMMILLLGTGLVLIERTVRRDLEQAARTENFVSAVTHELRTPLAAIRLYGEMLLDGWAEDPEKQREYYQRIVRETNRLSTLVERVLEKGRLTSSKVTAQAVDLRQTIEGMTEALAVARAPGASLVGGNDDLAFEFEDDLPHVLASLDIVGGILTNLVENARKYAPVDQEDPDAEPILIRALRDGDRVVLEVADRGPGIPAQDREQVFEAFHRLGNEETRTATGTGLGLHLVRLQAEAVQAKATVLGRPGGGSCFQIRFRLAGADEVAKDPPGAA